MSKKEQQTADIEQPVDEAGAVDQADEAQAGPEGVEECSVEDLAAALAEAEKRAEDNWNELLRVKAEMENLRKRAEKDVQNAHKYALERFVEGLLPVVDSLELGLDAAAKDDATLETIREGSEMTHKMLLQVLERQGVKVVAPEGERFNPDHHQAMSMQPHEGEPNTVITVMQKGYLLNDRLVRPALVVVSKPQ